MKKALGCLLILFLVGCSTENNDVKYLRVMVEDGIGYQVVSSNPLQVPYNGNCTFDITLDDGYSYVANSFNAPFENGKLYISNVRFAQTISVTTSLNAKYMLTIHNDDSLGSVDVNVANGFHEVGTEINIEVHPTQGKFISMTKDKTLYEAGVNVTYNSSYTFSLLETTELYINYYKSGYPTINYHGNNGHLENGEEDLLNIHLSEHHKRVNTLQGSHYFNNPGHTLTSWNTQPDGKGDRIGLGSRISFGEGLINLYAIWAEWTPPKDFAFLEKDDGTLTLVSYIGDDEIIVIPENVAGKKVTTIQAAAFVNLNMQQIILPTSIVNIEKDAFKNLTHLSSIVMFDNVKEIFDQSFVNCPLFTRLYMNAITPPCYCDSWASWVTDKYDALKVMETPKMVLYGGSSALYGFDTPLLNETFTDFTTYNFGWTFASSPRFLLNLILDTLTEGDKLVIAAENNWLIWGGNHDFSDYDWKTVETNYDLLEFANIKKHRAFFDIYNVVVKNKEKLKELTYDVYAKGLNEYGDYLNNTKPKDEAWFDPNTIFSFDASTLGGKLDWVNDVINDLTAKHIQSFLTFSPYNQNAVSSNYNTPELRAPYVAKYGESIFCPLISDLEDYFYPGNYFYDSNVHLTRAGATIRTQQLISDLTSYFD